MIGQRLGVFYNGNISLKLELVEDHKWQLIRETKKALQIKLQSFFCFSDREREFEVMTFHFD